MWVNLGGGVWSMVDSKIDLCLSVGATNGETRRQVKYKRWVNLDSPSKYIPESP